MFTSYSGKRQVHKRRKSCWVRNVGGWWGFGRHLTQRYQVGDWYRLLETFRSFRFVHFCVQSGMPTCTLVIYRVCNM